MSGRWIRTAAIGALAVAVLGGATHNALAEYIFRHRIMGFAKSVGPSDAAPDAFAIASTANAEPATQVTSAAVTPTGYDLTSAITVTGSGSPQISVEGGPWSAAGTISPGQTFRVRLTTGAAYSTATTATVTVGGIASVWTVTTRAGDAVPDAFNFSDLSGQAVNTLVTSAAITPTGYDAPAAVSVTGSGSPQVSIASGAWATSGTITPGQSLAVRLTTGAGSTSAVTYSATVTVGGVTDTWNVTTAAQYSYSWNTGGWGSCPASCGNWGTQSRSVWCQRSDGATVDGSYCGWGSQPSGSQTCYGGACPVTYRWSYTGQTYQGCGFAIGGSGDPNGQVCGSPGATTSFTYSYGQGGCPYGQEVWWTNYYRCQ